MFRSRKEVVLWNTTVVAKNEVVLSRDSRRAVAGQPPGKRVGTGSDIVNSLLAEISWIFVNAEICSLSSRDRYRGTSGSQILENMGLGFIRSRVLLFCASPAGQSRPFQRENYFTVLKHRDSSGRLAHSDCDRLRFRCDCGGSMVSCSQASG